VPAAGAREPGLIRAIAESLVVYDGHRLLHSPNPAEDGASWAPLPDVHDERLIALSSCPDLNSHQEQLFAVTESARLLSWTWRRPDSDGDPAPGWYAWSPAKLEVSPRALVCWSLGAGHQEIVIADADGELWSQRRAWDSGSGWDLIGIIKNVVALDAIASAEGTIELYAITADGELKRKVGSSPVGGGGSWGGVEVVAGWSEPAVALTTWTLPGQAENQAVLLAPGELRQRWRRPGSPAWSEWWSSGPVPVPPPPSGLTAWSTADGQQFIAVLAGTNDIAFQPWHPAGGWRPWLPSFSVSTLVATEPLRTDEASAASPVATAVDVLPADPDLSDQGPPPAPEVDQEPAVSHVADAVRAGEATVLFTGRELLPLLPDDPLQIGPFKLQKRVGGGQPSTDKFVARDGRGYCFLKVLKPDATPDEAEAFRRETGIAQRVTNRQRLNTFIDAHPGGDGRPAFLALSFVPGKHLGELIERKPMGEAGIVALARSLLEALVELEQCGIYHADLKPANVIMRDGDYPVVVDLGSAVPAGTTIVRDAAFGTVGYAAPEFAARREVNATIDTYSWGAVLLAAATGATPATDPQIRAGQLHRLPHTLRDLVGAALDEDPANRPSLDYADKHLARTHPIPEENLIKDRMGVDTIPPRLLPERIRRTPRRLVGELEQLPTWPFRAGLGIAALVGILFGFLTGLFLIQLIRG